MTNLDRIVKSRDTILPKKVHIVKGFGIVYKAEIDVFLELSCFFNDPMFSLNIWKFMIHVLLKPDLENFEHFFTSM